LYISKGYEKTACASRLHVQVVYCCLGVNARLEFEPPTLWTIPSNVANSASLVSLLTKTSSLYILHACCAFFFTQIKRNFISLQK